MFYREVNFSDRKPKWSANVYFYITYTGGHTFGLYNGYTGHMETHLHEYPDHKLIWLEPESEYNPSTYYNREIK